MNQAMEIIQELVRERFYGALTLKFEAGKVVYLKKEQTIRPSDLSEQPKERECQHKKPLV
jgi:hypothetical protein